jgi:fumarylacetoacetase
MSDSPDPTNDPSLRSWVESANHPQSDFPIQNLPFGRFKSAETSQEWQIGVAIGDMVLNIAQAGLINHSDMALLLSMSKQERQALRLNISNGLKKEGEHNRDKFLKALLPLSSVVMGLPCDVGDYTDFYIGIHHARAVGKLFRPDNALLPNYKWVPIGYHGRASTLNVSGSSFVRPRGQIKLPDTAVPEVQPTSKLDFELELGIVIGRANALGEPINIHHAEDYVFGLTLLNDWSARDIQTWEYQPLGPFLAKSFSTTISPWIVSLEALEPFRCSMNRPHDDPKPLPYLSSDMNYARGAFDIKLEVLIQTQAMRSAGLKFERICYSNFNDAAYWTIAQLVTHHTMNGCALRSGDLLGTGTLSGPKPEQAGSLIELTNAGKQRIKLSNGESRSFLENGDSICLKAWCERTGATRIGFGECVATVLPAPSPRPV